MLPFNATVWRTAIRARAHEQELDQARPDAEKTAEVIAARLALRAWIEGA